MKIKIIIRRDGTKFRSEKKALRQFSRNNNKYDDLFIYQSVTSNERSFYPISRLMSIYIAVFFFHKFWLSFRVQYNSKYLLS